MLWLCHVSCNNSKSSKIGYFMVQLKAINLSLLTASALNFQCTLFITVFMCECLCACWNFKWPIKHFILKLMTIFVCLAFVSVFSSRFLCQLRFAYWKYIDRDRESKLNSQFDYRHNWNRKIRTNHEDTSLGVEAFHSALDLHVVIGFYWFQLNVFQT